MKRLYLGLIALISLFILTPSAFALPNFIADNNLTLNQDYNDNTFIAGNVISVNSYINGLSFIAGNTVDLNGEADYSFVAANTITIKDYTAKDLFAAGNSIAIKDVNLRSIYASANTIDINASLQNIYAAGDTVTLTGEFDNVEIGAKKLVVDGKITGKLKVNKSCEIETKENTIINDKEEYEDKMDVEPAVIILGLTVFAIVAKLIAFVNALIVGIVIIALCKNGVKNLNDTNGSASNTVIKALIGFGLLIGVPFISIILACTGIFTALGVISLILYAVALYVSTIITSIFIATKLFRNTNVYLSYTLVLIIVTIIGFVPILGSLIKFIMLIIGLGLMLDFFKARVEIKEVKVDDKPKKVNTKKKEK